MTSNVQLTKVEALKAEGNISFQGGRIQEAIEIYTNALNIFPDHAEPPATILKSTLLSNRSMCHLKLYDKDSSTNTSLNCTIHDCTAALSLLQPCPTNAQPLQSKLLYRRAKARISLVSDSIPTDEESQVAQQLLDAEKDLRLLLSVDPAKKQRCTDIIFVSESAEEETGGLGYGVFFSPYCASIYVS